MTSSSKGGWLLWILVAMIYTGLTFGVVLDSCAGPPPASVVKHPTRAVTTRSQEVPARPCSSSYAAGIVLPRWTPAGYGPTDTAYQQALPQIQEQVHACWLELPILFVMPSPSSLVFDMGSAPTPTNLEAGIQLAHTFNFRVFLVPLITVSTPGGWAGSVKFQTYAQEAAWFALFYRSYAPYLAVAQRQHVEQVSIGTELAWMQQNAPQELWQTYITHITSVYQGSLTYDENWGELGTAIMPWMRSLSTLGVSEYIPLVDQPWHIAQPAMEPLFRQKVQSKLDALSKELGKPILVSEMGYRSTADALYKPWQSTGHPPQDREEQAQILSTALSVLTSDPHIRGSFVWAWSDAGEHSIEGSLAAQSIGTIYEKVEHTS